MSVFKDYCLRLSFFLLWFGSWQLPCDAQQDSIVLATYQYADNNRIANIAPLGRHLQLALGRPVAVRSYATVHAFLDGIRKNEVDIALINTFGYLLLEAGADNPMLVSVALQVKKGVEDNFKTAIMANSSYPADHIAGIKDHAAHTKLFLVSPGSTSGNLVPRLALNNAGLPDAEQQFSSVTYSRNHKAAIDSLLLYENAVAAAGNTEYLRVKQDSALHRQVKLLWLSPEIPLGPVLLHKRLSSAQRNAITSLLLQLHQSDAAALGAVKKGWSEALQAEKYRVIDKGYYDHFKKQWGDPVFMKAILQQFVN